MTSAAPLVLLVEDDALLRSFLSENLAADGFDPLEAGSAADGLRALQYKHPDVALVDLGLPDGSGLDLIARVRTAEGLGSRLDPDLPLLVLSGRDGELDRLRGFERGADDYVVKPTASLLAALVGSGCRLMPGQASIPTSGRSYSTVPVYASARTSGSSQYRPARFSPASVA